VHTVRPGLPIVTHFYDLIEPRSYKFPRGAWVNPQLNQIGAPKDQALRNAIAARLFFLAHERYADACKSTGVTFVDLRGTVNHRWFDEIHPSNAAFRDIATKLSTAGLPSLTTRRRVKKTPLVRTLHPRSRSGSSRRRARTTIAQAVSSKRSRALSKETKS
jgi:hypothetical protein